MSTNMESSREKEHLVALKVMRLTKPSLTLSYPITCSKIDLPGDTLMTIHKRNIASNAQLDHSAMGSFLTLPQNFGNIFLGETFSSYISVHNDSPKVVKDILVKADLQTSSQRLSLTATNTQETKELQPGLSVDDVIHHEVKELGTHILVCVVNYTSDTGEKLYFRKFFKFQVLKPLDVKTKFYNAEDISDEVYLEAQIQNATPGPIFMEKVNLEPSAQYTAKALNHIPGADSDIDVFGKVSYMNPSDIRQYLYCLTPKPDMYNDPKALKGVTNIGKLDIVWRTNMGEKGRLQTSALQRVAPGYGAIRVTVDTIPDAVLVEKTFQLKCKVTNCCDRAMDLVINLQNAPGAGVLWCGTSGKQVGQLTANSHIFLDFNLIAVKQGLQAVSGLRLTDTFLKRTYEHDEVAQIYVYSEDTDL